MERKTGGIEAHYLNPEYHKHVIMDQICHNIGAVQASPLRLLPDTGKTAQAGRADTLPQAVSCYGLTAGERKIILSIP
ncbi:hypothetical protein [Komagataeibacter sp. NFXK3]